MVLQSWAGECVVFAAALSVGAPAGRRRCMMTPALRAPSLAAVDISHLCRVLYMLDSVAHGKRNTSVFPLPFFPLFSLAPSRFFFFFFCLDPAVLRIAEKAIDAPTPRGGWRRLAPAASTRPWFL